MFVGRFEHTLDPKGRLVLPANFRERLAAGGYVTQGVDGCLAVWTQDEFRREAQEMVEDAKAQRIDRAALRAFSAGAAEVKPDTQGRIAIPANLRQFAGLRKDVVVIGAITSVEIWDAERWDAVNRAGEVALGAAGSPRTE